MINFRSIDYLSGSLNCSHAIDDCLKSLELEYINCSNDEVKENISHIIKIIRYDMYDYIDSVMSLGKYNGK